jgi:hypothetical protein
MRPLLAALLSALLVSSACSSRPEPADGSTAASTERGSSAEEPATATRAAAVAASTNLDTTPLSAADYAMYAGIMSGASALLANLTSEDRAALETAKTVDAGRRTAAVADEPLLAHARALHKDEELADLQGVGARYRQVKAKVTAVVGPDAQAPEKDDPTARENRRFLEAHRANIERLQRVLRDPLSRPKTPE